MWRDWMNLWEKILFLVKMKSATQNTKESVVNLMFTFGKEFRWWAQLIYAESVFFWFYFSQRPSLWRNRARAGLINCLLRGIRFISNTLPTGRLPSSKRLLGWGMRRRLTTPEI